MLRTDIPQISGEGATTMQLGQIASVWMMYDQQERLEAAIRPAHVATRPSLAQRFGGRLRRIAYRAQLGPVAGPSAA
jgi:hypothetical protein